MTTLLDLALRDGRELFRALSPQVLGYVVAGLFLVSIARFAMRVR